MRQPAYGLILFTLLIMPPIRHGMESVMILHMLVQIPLLIISGWLMAQYFEGKLERFFNKWNANGAAGIILVVIITIYWMIPRTLDDALVSGGTELFKFISLPFLAGVLLRNSWQKISPVIKSFIIFNYISMFGLLAWIYIDAPVRVCNSYLETDQTILGWGFLVITISLILYMLQSVFTDQSETAV